MTVKCTCICHCSKLMSAKLHWCIHWQCTCMLWQLHRAKQLHKHHRSCIQTTCVWYVYTYFPLCFLLVLHVVIFSCNPPLVWSILLHTRLYSGLCMSPELEMNTCIYMCRCTYIVYMCTLCKQLQVHLSLLMYLFIGGGLVYRHIYWSGHM